MAETLIIVLLVIIIGYLIIFRERGEGFGVLRTGAGRHRAVFDTGGLLWAETLITPDGGEISLGWFTIKFPSGIIGKEAKVQVFEQPFEPWLGIAIGGKPLRVRVIEPASCEIEEGGSGKAMPVEFEGEYSLTFHLDKIVSSEGDFSGGNKYIQVIMEWPAPGGGTHFRSDWGGTDTRDLTVTTGRNDITYALVDFSQLAKLASIPHIVKDPARFVELLYHRYIKAQFHPDNEGPLGHRIPVILIHGLNLAIPKEGDSLSDAEVAESQDVFQPLLDVLNYSPRIFAEFKFFWFTYPTGKTIFGPDGSGALLKKQLDDWAAANEPALIERPLIIVAHSMGGLVARDFMQNQGGNAFKLITICTPHYGSPVSNLGQAGLGRFAEYTTQGPKDLACDEEVGYKDLTGLRVAKLGNPKLRKLNEEMQEDDPRLVCYGATSLGHPQKGPVDPFDKVMLETLSKVTGPEWLMETADGYRSDGIIPWRSQYYCRQGKFPDPDFMRTSTDKYHRMVFHDFDILVGIYRDLIRARDEYRAAE